MARSQIPYQVRDAAGNVRSGVACTVTVRVGGANANVWSAETGGTSTAGTCTTDANGYPQGWLDEGSYNIQVTGTPNYTRAVEISRGDGTALVAAGAASTNKLAELTVASAKLANLAVTTPKYQDGGLANGGFADDVIDTRVLQDNAVTEPKIGSAQLSPRVVNAGALTSAKFANQSVGTAALADNAVTNVKLADNAVSVTKLASGSVTNPKLAATSIQGPKFGDWVIDLEHLDPNTIPIGTVLYWAASQAPSSKWLLCQGQALNRIAYATLFANIGTTFGTGDGSTTFNIPDLRGRSPWPLNSSAAQVDALGDNDGWTGGNYVYRGPRHHHTVGSLATTSNGDHAHFVIKPIWDGNLRSMNQSADNRFDGSQWTGHSNTPHGHSVSGSVGELSAVRDYAPFLTINFIIRVL